MTITDHLQMGTDMKLTSSALKEYLQDALKEFQHATQVTHLRAVTDISVGSSLGGLVFGNHSPFSSTTTAASSDAEWGAHNPIGAISHDPIGLVFPFAVQGNTHAISMGQRHHVPKLLPSSTKPKPWSYRGSGMGVVLFWVSLFSGIAIVAASEVSVTSADSLAKTSKRNCEARGRIAERIVG